MDVKSAFLYGKIEEEVYVCQQLGFEDPDFPDRVSKRKDRQDFVIRRDKGDILLVQVYVNDIIFGSTKKSLCTEFEKMMHKKFQMSFIGELTFFLGLQTADPPFSQISKSSPDAGFKPSSDDGKKFDEDSRNSKGIDQEKEDNVNSTNIVNAANTNEVNVVCGKISIELPDDPNMPLLEDIFYSDDDEDVGTEANMNNLDAFMPTASTPIETQKLLLKDEDGKEVDVPLYRSMIGSLMYLTSSRPDIMFAVCACARYQVNPKVSHLHAVKRIFRYIKGQPKLGLWYLKDSPFDLVAYIDSDYAGASLDRKSTIGGCQFLGCRFISWQCKKQTMVANSTT
ncbi:uncharacterized mitochondrial protein-like protein [Tanacetum coccineum]